MTRIPIVFAPPVAIGWQLLRIRPYRPKPTETTRREILKKIETRIGPCKR